MSEIITMLQSVGAVLTDDHFVYTSGRHGSVYVNKDALYPHTQMVSRVGELFAQTCRHLTIDTVVGPALGGIVLSQWTAYHLSLLLQKEVYGIYTEKDEQKNQRLTRGYDDFVKGKHVLVVEDLTTTGGSVLRVVSTVREAGGIVSGVAVMVNRNPDVVKSELFDAPFFALGVLPAQSWDKSDLPDWLEKRPINMRVGHGAKNRAHS